MAAKYSIDYFHQTENVLHETGTVDAMTGLSIVPGHSSSRDQGNRPSEFRWRIYLRRPPLFRQS